MVKGVSYIKQSKEATTYLQYLQKLLPATPGAQEGKLQAWLSTLGICLIITSFWSVVQSLNSSTNQHL